MASVHGRSMARFFIPQLGLGAFVTLLGHQIDSIDHRGIAKTVHIEMPKLSLAIAAIEDAYQTWSIPEEGSPARSLAVVQLRAGQSILPIFKSSQSEMDKMAPLVKVNSVAPMKIADVKVASMKVAALARKTDLDLFADTRLQGMVIRQPIETRETSAPLSQKDVLLSQLRQENVTPSLRERLVAEFSGGDWRQVTNSDRMKVAVEKELAERAKEDPTQKRVGSIFVGAPPSSMLAASPPATSPLPASENRPSLTTLASSGRGPLTFSQNDQAEQLGRSSVSALLSGSLVFKEGLALTDPSEDLVVYREAEGLSLERGQVVANEGRFTLSVRRLTGRLVAQLRNKRGFVLGQGELNLAKLQSIQGSQQIENLRIELRPAVIGARVKVESIHATDHSPMAVGDAEVQMWGEHRRMNSDSQHQWFSEAGLATGSSFVAEASARNHWGTLLVGVAGQEAQARLFPDKFMDALLNLTLGENKKLAQNSGLIWGRIIRQGQELSGAKVEMAGDHRIEPIYFNSLMMPDRYAESTGENGIFAMVWVTPGIQSVRVTYQGQIYPATIVPVSVGRVSYIELEVGEAQAIPVAVYDPFDGNKELQTVLRLAGDESSEIEVQGQGQLGLPLGQGIAMLEADAGDLYELGRYSITREQRQLRLPLVRHDWVQSVVARRRINLSGGGAGVIVGFVANDSFTVNLDAAQTPDQEIEIVYFDSNGRPIFGEEGVGGGGFIIFNVTPGLRTVTLASRNHAQIYRELMVVDGQYTNILNLSGVR